MSAAFNSLGSAGAVGIVGRERGGARFRLILFLLIVGAVAFVAWKTIPPYINNYQLEDWLRTQEPYWLANHVSDDVLVDNIMKEIDSHNIPATKDDVKILANNSRSVKVSIDYKVHIDLSVYQFDLHFVTVMDNQSLVQ
jgi:hypothetical protein